MNKTVTLDKHKSEFEQILHDTGHLWYVDIFISDTLSLPVEVAVSQFRNLLLDWKVPSIGVNITQYIINKRNMQNALVTQTGIPLPHIDEVIVIPEPKEEWVNLSEKGKRGKLITKF